MADRKRKIPYHCSFCRERLVVVPLELSDYLHVPMLVRPYQCPHCFAPTRRPFAWIGRLPFVGRLFQSQLLSQASKRSGMLSQRDDRIVSPAARSIAKVGRWVERCEKRIGRLVSPVARAVWAVLWYVPGRLFPKRKRRQRQMLKPQRWS
ncbi:MAG: hypothetical protein R3C59_02150 [Planctomycetaceae bacterium]